MITIAWYNIVAIIVGILFVCWMNSYDDGGGYLSEMGGAFVLLFVIIFYLIWGGIFWW